jgi:hypothetical protein
MITLYEDCYVILDEDLYRQLRYQLEMCWAGSENDQRAIATFKRRCVEREVDVSEEDLTALIRERYPDYDPTPRVEQITPKTMVSPPRNTTVDETSGFTEAVDTSQNPEPVETILEPQKRTWKQKPGKRQGIKETRQGFILAWMNFDAERIRGAYGARSLQEQMPVLNDVDERTVRRDLEEMYKAGKLKLFKKPKILPKGQKVYDHLYTSARNRNPNFKWWMEH